MAVRGGAGGKPKPAALEPTFGFARAKGPPAVAAGSAGAAELLVPEPRTFLQYRVNLATDFEDLGPRLDSLVIKFSDDIPASLAQARVQPNRAVVGRDTTWGEALIAVLESLRAFRARTAALTELLD